MVHYCAQAGQKCLSGRLFHWGDDDRAMIYSMHFDCYQYIWKLAWTRVRGAIFIFENLITKRRICEGLNMARALSDVGCRWRAEEDTDANTCRGWQCAQPECQWPEAHHETRCKRELFLWWTVRGTHLRCLWHIIFCDSLWQKDNKVAGKITK